MLICVYSFDFKPCHATVEIDPNLHSTHRKLSSQTPYSWNFLCNPTFLPNKFYTTGDTERCFVSSFKGVNLGKESIMLVISKIKPYCRNVH